jgi:tetratricopeptide (TPR) repeat protein
MQPEIIAVNERLKKHHLDSFQNLESSRHYKNLKERFDDEQWIDVYLDLTEQMFWLDPVEGVAYILPFILIASIYRRETCREAIKLGNFFEHALVHPYSKTWEWVATSFSYRTSHNPSHKELVGLEELEKITRERSPNFPQILLKGNAFQDEIMAALWWRLGEAYQERNDDKALEYYKQALNKLKQNTELRNVTAATALNAAYKLFNKKRYIECLPWIDESLEIKPDYIAAIFYLGVVHLNLKEYQKALTDFNRAIELAPDEAGFYGNRGATYGNLEEYQKALADHNRAIELAPNETRFYISRGQTHSNFNMFDEALFDLNHAITMDQYLPRAIGIRGEVYGKMEDYEEALSDFNLAIELEKDASNSWHNSKGLVLSYLGRYEEAIEAYEQSLQKDGTNFAARYNIAVSVTRLKGLAYAQPYIKDARSALLKVQNPNANAVVLYGIGGLEALAGNTSQALNYLKRAIFSSKHVIEWAKHDIAWDKLRNDPQFRNLQRSSSKRK